jgi:hypothetical protein
VCCCVLPLPCFARLSIPLAPGLFAYAFFKELGFLFSSFGLFPVSVPREQTARENRHGKNRSNEKKREKREKRKNFDLSIVVSPLLFFVRQNIS